MVKHCTVKTIPKLYLMHSPPAASRPVSGVISMVDALLLLMVTFIWGSNFVVIKWGLQGFDPLLLALLRFALAAVPLIFWLPKPSLKLGWLVVNGIVLGSGQFGLLFMALQNGIAPGLASLLMQLQVFITIVFSAIIFSERVSSRQVLGLLAAVAGLGLVGWHIDADLSLRGLALTLAATSFWAVSNLLTKHVAKKATVKINMLSFIVWSSLFAIPPLAAMVYFVVGPELALQQLRTASPVAWSAAVWQAVGNTLVGFGLWSVLLAKYPASVVTPWALLVPVFGMASSAVFFAESFPPWKMLVFILVIGGIALANWPARTASTAK
jgi:O-acetylserine/cysteine efflux transporter